jgi:hypothetical protein
MQKIITYSYPNRIQLLADLAGFTVEYTNVYQRNVKIYNGIDNTLEFDIKNADQKRIDLTTFDSIQLNVMDAAGNALPNSPYDVEISDIKGISTVIIPSDDLVDFTPQFFKYTVVAEKDGLIMPLYTDGHFSAVGMLELVASAIPTTKPSRVFNTFTAELDYLGNPTHHSSAIPARFYEAIPTTTLSFSIKCDNFIGTIYLEGTTASTISVDSFKKATTLQTWTTTVATSNTITFSNVPVGDFCHFRVYWTNPKLQVLRNDLISYTDQIQAAYGKITKIVVN